LRILHPTHSEQGLVIDNYWLYSINGGTTLSFYLRILHPTHSEQGLVIDNY
jgi:hypothetical protein